jgi:nicotinate-nucleotide pyrophosphorylase (carboxylating)
VPELAPTEHAALAHAVARALDEDRAHEDVTTLATVDAALAGEGEFAAKQDGVLAGLPVVLEVYRQLDPRIEVEPLVRDGERFAAGATVAVARGPVRGLLQGERVALNFLQRLRATATLTRRFVDAVAGTRAVILDTRKTTPGLRGLEKYAVRCGGGTNHRRDLAVMAMIKDNHREALARAGRTLAEGVVAIRRSAPGIPVEVEIDALAELEAALAAGPEWLLLDNMSLADMRQAVARVAGRAKLEASGGVRLETVGAIAETGVDAISVGALTHSAPALDIGLDLRF